MPEETETKSGRGVAATTDRDEDSVVVGTLPSASADIRGVETSESDGSAAEPGTKECVGSDRSRNDRNKETGGGRAVDAAAYTPKTVADAI